MIRAFLGENPEVALYICNLSPLAWLTAAAKATTTAAATTAREDRRLLLPAVSWWGNGEDTQVGVVVGGDVLDV